MLVPVNCLSPWWISFGRVVLPALIGITSLTSLAFSEAKKEATHKQAYTVKPEVQGKSIKLETFCVGPRGNLWMACRSSSTDGSPESGLIMVYDPSGLLFDSFPLSFVPQAINFSPNSKLYVAGSGKIARVALNGSVEIEIDAPNIGNREEAIAKARKEGEKELTEMRESMEQQKQKIEEQIAKLKETPDDEDKKAKTKRERRLKVLEQQLKVQTTDAIAENTLSDQDILARLLSSTAIAATDNEVYVSCPEQVGYGYGIWRLSPDLTVEAKIIDEARGCCGQFDIQTDGTNLLLAENTKFEVGIYDRNGKRLSGFGKRTTGDQDGFGSCCNPMNVRCDNDGDILTAESSIGHIKRFSRDGRLLSYIGTAKVAGGCKHVAIGFDPDRNWYYMMHEDLSHVAVLVLKEEAPEETEDERLSREAMEGLGKKLVGTWELQQPKAKTVEESKSDEVQSISMKDMVVQSFGHIEFAPDGSLQHAAAAPSIGSIVQDKQNSKWSAVRQTGDQLEMITIEDEVPGFGAVIKFQDDETARFDFFYSTPASKFGTFTFKRTSYDACGQNCSDGKKCSNEVSKKVEKSEDTKKE